MTKLFRNDSPGALTLEQARELEIKRLKGRRRRAEELAAHGRGEDTEIAHVALGELIIPELLQTPELMETLGRVAEQYDIPLGQLRVGSSRNSINPNTGIPEFIVISDENRKRFYERSMDKTLPPPGVPERIMHGFMTPVRGAGEGLANIGGLLFNGARTEAQRLTGYNAAMEDTYQARRAAGGQTGFDAPRFAGEMLSGYALGRALPAAVSYAGATGLGAANGAIQSALRPVADPNGPYWEQKLEQIKKGAITGAIEGRAGYLGRKALNWFSS